MRVVNATIDFDLAAPNIFLPQSFTEYTQSFTEFFRTPAVPRGHGGRLC